MKVTVQDVMDKLMEPVGRLTTTVDGLKAGDPSMAVTGIVTTFLATHQVVQQTAAIGANFIITHEGVFYSHLDNRGTLARDSVFLQKKKLIEESGIAIFRFHDYLHRYYPDGVMAGLLESLGWQSSVVENRPTAAILTIPAGTVKEISEHLKAKLGIPFLRVAGDLNTKCERVGLLVGYRGGGNLAIPLFDTDGLDLIIAGEGPEWETPEYVRDAVFQGREKVFILLGHAQSEEPGMRHLADLMKTMFPDIPIHFIREGPCFQIV